MIAFYGRTLKVVLNYQPLTLLIALGTLVLTVVLYIIIPKGFFPVQDTGVIQGISQAPQAISFAAMSEQAAGAGQSHPARSCGGKPLVVHRRGRHQHHPEQRAHFHQLKAARASAHISASDVIRRLQTICAGPGHAALHAAGAEHHGG